MKQGKTPPLFWVRDEEQGFGGEGKGLLASRKAGKMPLVFELEQNRAALLALHVRKADSALWRTRRFEHGE